MSREQAARARRVDVDFDANAPRPTGHAVAGLGMQEASRQGVTKAPRPSDDGTSRGGALPAQTGSDWPFT